MPIVLCAQLTRDLFVIAKFLLHSALVRLNAYQCAKFQLPSSISLGDMNGVSK